MPGRKPEQAWRSVISAAAAGVTLAVVATLLTVSYFRQHELGRTVDDLERRLGQAEIEARDAANRTTRAREQATELIDFFVGNLRDELEPIGRTDIIESAASQAEAYFESLPPDAIGADANFHHAKMLLARGQAHYHQGALAESEAAYEEALVLLGEIPESDGDAGLVLNYKAIVHNEFALTYAQDARFDEARAENDAALAAFEKLHEGEPENADWLHGMAMSKLGIAETLRGSDRRAEALAIYDEAIDYAVRSLAGREDDVHHLATQMFAHTNKGYCLSLDKRYAETAEHSEQASRIAEQLIELEPNRKKWKKEYATLVNNFGSILDDQGESERARPLIEKARRLRKELVNFDPANGNWRADLANSEYNLAMNFLERGEVTEGWAATQQYLSHISTMLRSEPGNKGWHQSLARYADRLTGRFGELGADAEAAKVHESIERLYRDLSEAQPEIDRLRERRAMALYFAGDSRKRAGDLESCLAHHELALPLRLELFRAVPDDPERRYMLATALGNYAQALANLERFREALDYFQLAYATYLELPDGHGNRDRYLSLDEKNIREMRVKLGLVDLPESLIAKDATWSYWDSGEAPAPGWQTVGFDADAWKSGAAQLGYGEGDETTRIGFGPDPGQKFPTAYFRHQFEVGATQAAGTLHLNLVRDDGAVVYLNGEEVSRDLMPEEVADFSTYATDFVPNDVENEPLWIDLPAGATLVPGSNVLAVEIHQSAPDSSDLSFSVELFNGVPVLDPLDGFDPSALEEFLALPPA
ncbi:MAG: tetratricopeptide repeat protein [Verrucomicrobiales bacterium]